MIHGMNPNRNPGTPYKEYGDFWNALVQVEPGLKHLLNERVFVEWGHQLVPGQTALRDDQKLTATEEEIHRRVGFDEIRKVPGPNNVILNGWGGDWGIPGVRQIGMMLRESIVLHGLTDVVYYTSLDGERRVRAVAYDQALRNLDQYLGHPDVRFHLFSHSLGVTIAHDFLYGLFAPDHTPDFLGEQFVAQDVRDRYAKWRDKAQKGELRLGGFASAASQLPLFIMRKQKLVDCLFKRQGVDPRDIGIQNSGTQWKIFYDVDDILGFATRGLYSPDDAIMDIQVDCGDEPKGAHIGYWRNKTVIRETAKLFRDWAG